MAPSSPLLLNFLSSPSTYPSPQSLCFLIPHPQKNHSLTNFKALKLTTVCCCTPQTIQLETQQQQQQQQSITKQTKKKKRKPRPSFIEQIQHKWSLKNTSLRDKLPWQEQEQVIEPIEEDEEQSMQLTGVVAESEAENEKKSTEIDSLSYNSESKVFLPPWAHGKKPKKMFDVEGKNLENSIDESKNIDGFLEQRGIYVSDHFVQESSNLVKGVECDDKSEKFQVVKSQKNENLDFESEKGLFSRENSPSTVEEFNSVRGSITNLVNDNSRSVFQGSKGPKKEGNADSKSEEFHIVEVDANTSRVSKKNEFSDIEADQDVSFDANALSAVKEFGNVKVSGGNADSLRLPWERGSDENSIERMNTRRSNTELAEKLIPEPELKRLRNLALRMVERIKVRAAGVTEALVDAIHEKWRDDEVVKLKFEGPHAKNMKRTHEFLESRTGGLVIWRSGSSVVLYRGMTYKLPCVQSYREENRASTSTSESPGEIVNDVNQSTGVKYLHRSAESATTDSVKYLNSLSDEELMDLSELNHLLDELGPRFKDWSGREPVPVDADLLPATVPKYKPPFRLLPHGIRRSLRDKEVTYYRQMARIMPPHFALGRNRELQGLAKAMVKLWERSAIAKIAIKRGVQNTLNERMAEELKVLTGGTLLSRNKDYIVFYRGNDFLSPGVMEALVEAKKSAILHQDEEELARQKATTFIHSNANFPKQPLVAGTLSETVAATSRWAKQPSTEDIKKMMRDSAVARHASLVKFLENKLALAKGKIGKAEKALLKTQENLLPAELPTDLETLSNEERFLYRKIGLSMKPYLELGRRGVFDGTVENMHLHWKYRELVKIIVERKNLAQVKHIAISLEAESGGVLVSVDKTSKGHAIIIYRGKNYQRPSAFRPKNLLTRRQALARSIELQRREALKHHVSELQEKIEKLKSELEELKTIEEIDETTLYSRIDNASDDDDDVDGSFEATSNLQPKLHNKDDEAYFTRWASTIEYSGGFRGKDVKRIG